jgi:hypothetical protein
MRMGACILLIALASGCASQKPAPAPAVRFYESRSAGSLVFDPPVTSGLEPLELARQDRNPEAFAGFDDTTATFFWVRTDDRFTDDRSGRFERRAVLTKVGVSYR